MFLMRYGVVLILNKFYAELYAVKSLLVFTRYK